MNKFKMKHICADIALLNSIIANMMLEMAKKGVSSKTLEQASEILSTVISSLLSTIFDNTEFTPSQVLKELDEINKILDGFEKDGDDETAKKMMKEALEHARENNNIN